MIGAACLNRRGLFQPARPVISLLQPTQSARTGATYFISALSASPFFISGVARSGLAVADFLSGVTCPTSNVGGLAVAGFRIAAFRLVILGAVLCAARCRGRISEDLFGGRRPRRRPLDDDVDDGAQGDSAAHAHEHGQNGVSVEDVPRDDADERRVC